nr:uncharacterized protein LOC9269462 isoform X4 [Oryza sativa Japonica Group]XP_025879526.1 uncharacterized protein LOC9269462 isoform X4 [Oryza sativa Japonica Group]
MNTCIYLGTPYLVGSKGEAVCQILRSKLKFLLANANQVKIQVTWRKTTSRPLHRRRGCIKESTTKRKKRRSRARNPAKKERERNRTQNLPQLSTQFHSPKPPINKTKSKNRSSDRWSRRRRSSSWAPAAPARSPTPGASSTRPRRRAPSAPTPSPSRRSETPITDYCQHDGIHKYILIDVGKTFREQVLRWFSHHKIPYVDSIILTHEHADAVLGLDDVWVVQPSGCRNGLGKVPIFLTHFTMNSVAARFPYLLKNKLEEGDEGSQVIQLDWTIIEGDIDKPFVSSGLEFVPLPVMHGEDYVCLGFLFGRRSRIAYLSDVSRILPRTEHAISKSGAGQLDLLILETNELHGETSPSVNREMLAVATLL